MKKFLFLIFLLPFILNSAFANSYLSVVQLGAGLSGTTGINGFIGYANKKSDSFFIKRLGFRADFAKMPELGINPNVKLSDNSGTSIKIDNVKIDSWHFGGLFDIYPFGNTWFLGGLKLTAGYLFGNFNVSSVLKNSNDSLVQEFEIDGKKYKYDNINSRAKSQLSWNISGLYLGGGFDLGLFYGIKIFFDLGAVLVNNSPTLDLDIPTESLKYFNKTTNSWDSVNTPALKNALNDSKNKAIREINESLEKIKAFPVVKIGLLYRF